MSRCGLASTQRGDRGAVSVVVVVVVLFVLIGVAAMVVDVGALFAERRRLQTAADAAALAGVQELPSDASAAAQRARRYTTANAPEATDVEVTFPAADKIKVYVRAPDVGLFFARVFEVSAASVSTSATARITSPVAYSKGVIPLGVFPAPGSESATDGYGYGWGQQVTLKRAGGQGQTGNYGWIDLGQGQGASALADMLEAGGGSVQLWQLIDTTPGNKVPAADGLGRWIGTDLHSFSEICPPPDANGVVHVVTSPSDPPGGCHRLVLCPIVINPNPSDDRYGWPSGSSSKIQVVGFAQFFVESWGGQGKDAWVKGRFVRTVSPNDAVFDVVGSSGQVHYGLVP